MKAIIIFALTQNKLTDFVHVNHRDCCGNRTSGEVQTITLY